MEPPEHAEVPRPPQDPLTHNQRRARRPASAGVLRRSRDRLIGGVAGGVATYINANPTAVRWGFAIVLVLSAGVFSLAYVLLWLLLPGPDSSDLE